MAKSFWEKVDAYMFRIFGIVLGFSGCAGLLLNNPVGELFANIYGLIFLLMFGFLGLYSAYSFALDILKS